jgi:hypothetical protein
VAFIIVRYLRWRAKNCPGWRGEARDASAGVAAEEARVLGFDGCLVALKRGNIKFGCNTVGWFQVHQKSNCKPMLDRTLGELHVPTLPKSTT